MAKISKEEQAELEAAKAAKAQREAEKAANALLKKGKKKEPSTGDDKSDDTADSKGKSNDDKGKAEKKEIPSAMWELLFAKAKKTLRKSDGQNPEYYRAIGSDGKPYVLVVSEDDIPLARYAPADYFEGWKDVTPIKESAKPTAVGE